ncbi:hypothetical protein EZS27_014626 [termite gut metagenome]|uniref:Uncharacterized protein n=1 Tax=termite gut metagenome TaxID=433724 RepID=A0A5J4RUJ5_9ZZZZ
MKKNELKGQAETFNKRGFIVIEQKEYDENSSHLKNVTYIVKEDLFEVIDDIDSDHNGCWDFLSPDSDAREQCQDEIQKEFGIEGKIDDDGDFIPETNISEEIKTKITEFIEKWEKENFYIPKIKAYEYFNGSNWTKIVLEEYYNDNPEEGVETTIRLEDEELENEILKVFFDKLKKDEEIQEETNYFGSIDEEGYNFKKPFLTTDYWIAKVE